MLSNHATTILNGCMRFAQRAWPLSCVLCGAGARHTHRDAGAGRFCGPCEASLLRVSQARCSRCALPLASGTTCGACSHQPPAYDDVNVAFAYAFPLDALIQRYKYGPDLALAPVLAALLAPVAASGVEMLIPMPLSQQRLRERGFNQAYELARHLGREIGLPVLAHAARKVTETTPQAALPWHERAGNVRGVFVCDMNLAGKHVAIVDDVMTTGATLNELAKNAKRAGAARVSGWVLARTLPT